VVGAGLVCTDENVFCDVLMVVDGEGAAAGVFTASKGSPQEYHERETFLSSSNLTRLVDVDVVAG
jgi:hypothetical protein